jgi:hypothetical protein
MARRACSLLLPVKRSVTLLLVSAGALPLALADNAALQRCRDLRDAAARLACYDAIPLSASSSTAPSALPATAPQPAAAFGLESRPAPSAAPQPLTFIESAIDGPFDGWLPRGQLKLANGQAWEVTDGSQAAYRLQSPKVKITRGVSGSFFMTIDGVAQTPRVRRVR